MVAIAVPHFAPMHSQLVQYLLPPDEDFPGHAAKELLQRIFVVRVKIFHSLTKRLQEGPVSLGNLLQQPIQEMLQDGERHIGKGRKMEEVSRGMLTLWRKRNLLTDQQAISLENIASLLITTSQSNRMQAFLPTYTLDPEPSWWCFAQLPPRKAGEVSAYLPCPVPLPATLPKGTLLLSPWPAFSPEWENAGPYGAVRFYQLEPAQMRLWAPELMASFSSKINEHQQAILEKTLVLEKIRTLLLNPKFTLFHDLESIPLVWEKEDLLQQLSSRYPPG